MNHQVDTAVSILKAGGVIVFPTDTVWGIGAFVGSSRGVEKLYSLKKRDPNKPTALLVGSLNQAREYGEFSSNQLAAVAGYWPGALTVVVKAKTALPPLVLNNEGGVGIRWPQSTFVERVTEKLSGALVASSANVSGGLTPIHLSEVDQILLDQCDLVVEYAGFLSGTASTVIDLMGTTPRTIRQGALLFEAS